MPAPIRSGHPPSLGPNGGTPASRLRKRLAAIDWPSLVSDLDRMGHARLPDLLAPEDCRNLIALYERASRFRSVVDMDRHQFGSGEYRYFARPLPRLVGSLRSQLYTRLRPIANRWNAQLAANRASKGAVERDSQAGAGEMPDRFPEHLKQLERACAAAGQNRPTPLLLRYTEGGFNRLHQDRYGAVSFPLQVAILLSSPSIGQSQRDRDAVSDFSGGEFLVAEQCPRQQARVDAIAPERGEGIVFANDERPVAGSSGIRRARMRHGVSRIHSGERFTLGIIFHDAS